MQNRTYLVIGADGDNVTSEDGRAPRPTQPGNPTQEGNPTVHEYLNFLASQGWELVTTYNAGGSQVRFVFKRVTPQSPGWLRVAPE